MAAQQPFYPAWSWHQEQRYWYFQHPTTRQVLGFDQNNNQLVDLQTGLRTPRWPHIVLPQELTAASQQHPASPSQSTAYTSTRPQSQSSHETDQLATGIRSLNLGHGSRPRSESVASGGSSLREAAAPLNTPIPSAPMPRPATTVRSRVTERNGMRLCSARNDVGVRTIFADHPPERITDPVLLRAGVTAHRRLMETEGQQEALYSTFKHQRPGFFVLGRVFQILWSEPAGRGSTQITNVEPTDAMRAGVFAGRHGEYVYSKVRLFVVVRPSHRYSSAVPIMSYDHQGVAKDGVIKHEHAIIFTGTEAPRAHRDEAPARGETPMRPQPIRVVPDDPIEKLDEMSRINFGKVHTIEHNLKVRTMGMVHPHYLATLSSHFANVVLPASIREDPRAQALLTRQVSHQEAGRSGSTVAQSVVSGQSGSSSLPNMQHDEDASDQDDDNIEQDGDHDDDEEEEDGNDDEEDGNDDEEDGNDDDGEDANDGQATPRSSRRDLIVRSLQDSGLTETQAEREADIAIRIQEQYQQLLLRRHTPGQAIGYLADKVQERIEGMPRDAAIRQVTARLRYGS